MAEMPELALGKDQREFGVPRPFGAGIGHRWLTEPLQGFGIELDAAGRSRKTPPLARPLAGIAADRVLDRERSEEHTSELQSLMRISYAVFCLKKKNNKNLYTFLLSSISYTIFIYT